MIFKKIGNTENVEDICHYFLKKIKDPFYLTHYNTSGNYAA